MATEGAPSSESTEDRRESLTCSFCLEVFKDPKLLPCSHTFCLKCLEDLTSKQSSSTFPCPNCRRDVTIPSEGVAAFQNNFYLRPEELDTAQDGTLCLTHPKQDLDLYCVDCQLPVCLKCVLTKHKQHTTKDLSEAVSEARTQLGQDRDRLQKAVSHMTEVVAAEKKEQQALQDKKAAVKTAIRNKHATLMAMADQVRDELLADVDTQCEEVEQDLVKDLDIKQNNLDQLLQLQRLQETISNSREECQLLAVAKEMREGRGSPGAVSDLMLPKRDFIYRPVQNSKVTDADTAKRVQDYCGRVEKVPMELPESEVTVAEQFRCGDETDIDVFSLCVDSGNVWIAFARRGMKEDAPCKRFDKKGKALGKASGKAFGPVSWRAKGDGKGMYTSPTRSGLFNNFSKSCSDEHLKLMNYSSGKTFIKREVITSRNPFDTKITTECQIKLGGPNRTFDASGNQQLFVVVEEPHTPDTQRKVRLYRRLEEVAVDTYKPPTADFKPTDVCFYKLGGQEVLLVSDEWNDCIHVLQVKDGTLQFLRYLAPGCPLVVQPTAMNTDSEGRLWVACKGGSIITMTPV